MFLTLDRGQHWIQLKNNLPTVAVRAMAIQERERELVAGTFGRAIWVIDIAPFEEMTPRVLDQPAYVFEIKPGTLFKTRFTYGATIEELNGDMFFRAENPPYGTTITYYLGSDVGKEVTLVIKDGSGKSVRTLTGPGSTGIHRVNWDLKRQERITDAQAELAGVTTISEREALDRVPAGKYSVVLDTGKAQLTKEVIVRPEPQSPPITDVRK